MSELTFTLLRLGYLVLLWVFVLSAVAVLRRDLAGPRTTSGRRRRSELPGPAATPAPGGGAPRAPQRGGPSRLVVVAGPLTGTTIPLTSSGVLIGRAPSCTLVLDDDYSSSRHARIFPQGGQWFVEDLGSTNGTYIGEERVQGIVPLAPGVGVQIGQSVVESRDDHHVTVTLRYAARSDVGLVRSNNQDSAYAGPNLLVVADGMGGHAGGDVASALTIAALVGLDRPDHSSEQSMSQLERTIDRARQDLVDATAADPDLAGMGTTVTALLKSGNTLAMAHLGDSRAYLLRDGVLAQVTVDHTFVQHLVDTGRITPDEAETHPQRNVVMRVLGDFDLDLTPDLSIREAIPGDRWMLCSDGLSGFVPEDQIAEVLVSVAEPEDAVERLVSMSMRAGSTDNITVVVADVLDEAAAAGTTATVVPEIVGSAALAGVTAAGDDAQTPTHLHAQSPGVDGDTVTGFVRPASDDQGGTAPAAVSVLAGTVTQDGLADTLEQAVIANGSEDEQYQPDVRPDDEDEEDDEDARPARGKRAWLTVLGALLLVVGLGLAGWGGYRWTQTQYYVGESDGQVAVFRGIPATAGPLTFSTAVELTGTRVDELPPFVADRVHETIRATSLEDARGRADRLIADAEEETGATPSPSATPSSTPTSTPSSTPTPTQSKKASKDSSGGKDG